MTPRRRQKWVTWVVTIGWVTRNFPVAQETMQEALRMLNAVKVDLDGFSKCLGHPLRVRQERVHCTPLLVRARDMFLGFYRITITHQSITAHIISGSAAL